MIYLGQIQKLIAYRISPHGFYLSDLENNEVLLPQKFVPTTLKPGDEIEVFVFNDNENRPTATTQKPMLVLGQARALTVIDKTSFGYFLDWGLDKHLLLPKNQTTGNHQPNQKVMVTLYLDIITNRLAASEKIDQFLKNQDIQLKEGEKVSLEIWRETPLGYVAVINQSHLGILYKNNTPQPLNINDIVDGYVQKIRPDGKIDLTLFPKGDYGQREAEAKIITMLQAAPENFLPYGDHSSPEEILATFGMSKKLFKKSIGGLFKKQHISISKAGIKLIIK